MSKKKHKKQKASVKEQGSNVSNGRPSGEALNESEKKELEMFRDVAECAFDWIYEVDAEGICTYASSAVERSMGYRPQDMVGLLFTDFFHPDDREQLIKAAQALMARKQSFREFVARYVHKNGQTVWLSTSGTPVFDDKGNLLGYRGTNTDITDRVRIEEALRESEERYRSLFENSPISIGLGSPDGKVISANKAMLDMTGYSVEEVPKVNLNDVYENLEDRKALLEQVKQYGGVSNFPARIKRKDGTVIDVLLSASAVHVGDEQLLQTTLIDVTERKQAEEAAKQALGEWQITFDSTNDLMMLLDGHSGIIKANLATEKFLQKPRPEICGKKCYQLFHGTDAPPDFCPAEKARRTKRREEAELYLQDKDMWVSVTIDPRLDEKGRFVGAVQVIKDITERKRAENELRQSEKRFRDISDCSLDWIWEVDVEGRYTYASPAVEVFLGYMPQDVVGKYYYDFFHPDDRGQLKKAASAVFARKERFHEFINRNVHKNGRTIWLSTSGTPILDDDGNLLGYRGSDTDITESKEAAEQLKAYSQNLEHMVEERTNELDKVRARLFHSSKLVAVGRMGAGIAHQLNSPLCSGILFVDSLMQDYQNAPKQQRVLQNVRRSLMDMRDIVECMLSMAMVARPGAPSRANVNLNEVLKRVVDVAGLECKKRHVTVEILFDPELPAIEAVVGELDQVFINLVNNAIDAMADGGMLSVHTVSLPGSVEIHIRDTGKGIAPEHLDQIFEPFFTTRLAERGIGLGLSVTREIVERHRGHISVKSQPGKGSTFTVRLPVPSHKPATGV